MKKNFPIYCILLKLTIFLNFETESSLSTSVFMFSNNPEILETKFHALWTQKCRNIKSIKYANFVSVVSICTTLRSTDSNTQWQNKGTRGYRSSHNNCWEVKIIQFARLRSFETPWIFFKAWHFNFAQVERNLLCLTHYHLRFALKTRKKLSFF